MNARIYLYSHLWRVSAPTLVAAKMECDPCRSQSIFIRAHDITHLARRPFTRHSVRTPVGPARVHPPPPPPPRRRRPLPPRQRPRLRLARLPWRRRRPLLPRRQPTTEARPPSLTVVRCVLRGDDTDVQPSRHRTLRGLLRCARHRFQRSPRRARSWAYCPCPPPHPDPHPPPQPPATQFPRLPRRQLLRHLLPQSPLLPLPPSSCSAAS